LLPTAHRTGDQRFFSYLSVLLYMANHLHINVYVSNTTSLTILYVPSKKQVAHFFFILFLKHCLFPRCLCVRVKYPGNGQGCDTTTRPIIYLKLYGFHRTTVLRCCWERQFISRSLLAIGYITPPLPSPPQNLKLKRLGVPSFLFLL
jgi:hypothetical protein